LALPTYFISRSDRQSAAQAMQDVSESVHVVDVFRTLEEPDRYHEWMVTVDALGRVHAFRAENRDTFPEVLQSELAYQELISSSNRRVLQLKEFFLIGARYLDQPAQAPGPNDPVHLYGTLYGPYRNVQDAGVEAFEGQLTLTRADVLEALLLGAPHAFRYPSPSGEDRSAPGCLHMMLPADREETISQGRGVALAYLLMPSDLMLADAANELLAAQTIYELLSALKQDLRKDNVKHSLSSLTLPVPSRAVLERQLQAEGYTIEGNEAIRTSTSKGFTGFLAAVFGVNEKRLQLPPEGRLEDFLRIAHVTLSALPGWPTPRAIALRARTNPQAKTPFTQKIPVVTATPAPAPAPAPASPAKPKEVPQRPGPVWKKGGGTPRKQDWMDDFEKPPKKSESLKEPKNEPKTERTKKTPEAKPDWMKDFE